MQTRKSSSETGTASVGEDVGSSQPYVANVNVKYCGRYGNLSVSSEKQLGVELGMVCARLYSQFCGKTAEAGGLQV